MARRPTKGKILTETADSPFSADSHAKNDYYGAMIRGADVGPRRELTLRIEMWPKEKAKFGGGGIVSFRLGAIENFEEIQKFFSKLPADGLHFLREMTGATSRRHVIELEFDRTGKRIAIIAAKVSKRITDPTSVLKNDASSSVS